jgi:hypothetical protein
LEGLQCTYTLDLASASACEEGGEQEQKRASSDVEQINRSQSGEAQGEIESICTASVCNIDGYAAGWASLQRARVDLQTGKSEPLMCSAPLIRL